MAWKTIPDSMVAAWQPVLARLASRLRRRAELLRTYFLKVEGWSATRSTSTSGWETIDSWPVFVADVQVGAGDPEKTEVSIEFDTTLDSSTSAAGQFRIAVGSDTSNEVSLSVPGPGGGSDASLDTYVLQTTVTANSVVQIDLQMNLGGTPDGGAVMTARNGLTTYVRPRPVVT